jgi:hypothetical protein
MSSQVVAIASCGLSSVQWMQSDETLSRDTRMVRVHVTLLDVDGLPMNVTWPEGTIEIVSPSSYFKLQLLRPPLGLSESLVEIPPGIRSDPGSYVVRVWLSNSWDGAKQTRGQCLLFERTVVVVEAGLDYKLVILLALLATVLLVLSAVLTFLIYKNQAKAKQLLLSVVEFEGLLAVEIAAEVCLCRFVLPYSGGWYAFAFRTFLGLCPFRLGISWATRSSWEKSSATPPSRSCTSCSGPTWCSSRWRRRAPSCQ